MAVDYFLKIAGIPGESADSKHKDEIELLSWSWGATQTGTMARGGGGGAGRADVHDLVVQMGVNKASPNIMKACVTGEHLKDCVLTGRKAGKEQQDYFKIKLTDVLVTSVQLAGAGETPSESVSFNFTKVEYEYKLQKADGSLGGAVAMWWDQKAVKGG